MQKVTFFLSFDLTRGLRTLWNIKVSHEEYERVCFMNIVMIFVEDPSKTQVLLVLKYLHQGMSYPIKSSWTSRTIKMSNNEPRLSILSQVLKVCGNTEDKEVIGVTFNKQYSSQTSLLFYIWNHLNDSFFYLSIWKGQDNIPRPETW